MLEKKNKQLCVVLLCLVTFAYSGCKVFARENVPYVINGNFVMEDNLADFEICGVDLYFLNKSEKDVKDFTVIFFLFDEEGEPVNTTKNNLVFTVKEELGGMEDINLCLSLDKYVNYVPDNGCFIDYLYVSHITYMDESEWSDPFGLYAY